MFKYKWINEQIPVKMYFADILNNHWEMRVSYITVRLDSLVIKPKLFEYMEHIKKFVFFSDL